MKKWNWKKYICWVSATIYVSFRFYLDLSLFPPTKDYLCFKNKWSVIKRQTNQATADYMEWLQVTTGQTISDYKWLWARLWVTTSDNLLRVTSDYGWLQVSIRVIHVAGDCKWIGMTSNENEARIKNSSFTETLFLFKPIFYLLTEF